MNEFTVKNYKEHRDMSEETICFSASLYLDGKKIGSARNDGRGGDHYLDFLSKQDEERFYAAAKEWIESEEVQSDPRFQLSERFFPDREDRCFADADSFVDQACEEYARKRDMKKQAKKDACCIMRIERPQDWQIEIMEFIIPNALAAEKDSLIEQIKKEKAQAGDSIFFLDPQSGEYRKERA